MTRLPALLKSLLLALLPAAVSAAPATPSYRQQAFELPARAESLVVADLDGDGLSEFITIIDQSIRLYLPGPNGYDFTSGFFELPLESEAVGWDIATGFTGDGGPALITLQQGRLAQAWPLRDGTLGAPITIADNLPGFITRGVTRLHFARDIDGDGREDLVIPGAGLLHIFINEGDGFQAPLSIQSETRLRTQLNIDRLNRSAGQAIRIPFLELRDVNGDGANDLVSRTEERLDVFLARRDGAEYFPRTPSYSLDIAAIEEALGEFDVDNLDFSNLTGVLALTHEEILEDVDNDGIDDLLLREGGKVSLFSGTADGMNFDTPRQVLRSSGNVLSAFLYDEDEDGLKDLWLWRVEPISVGDLFVWLALSGSITIEAFIYPNEGERFARRPARRITVALRFPSVIRLANVYEALSSEADRLGGAEVVPAATADVSPGDERRDVVMLVNDQVRLFLDSIEPEPEEASFLGPLGYTRQRDSYTLDIREILERVTVSANPYAERVAGREPDLTIELST
ncbi:MAG: VCBS repeat-containing protein, partial [Pseudohongiellaceae bacterium]